MLSVTTPAPDRSLLTLPELRGAVGVPDKSSDADLLAVGDRIAGVVARFCNIASDGVHPPTLREETLTEAFRLQHRRAGQLILARRPVLEILSLTVNDTVLTADQYELLPAAGIVMRLENDWHRPWPCGKVTVSYRAGLTDVPDDLKLAAVQLARILWSEQGRDPLIRSESIPDVISTSYWVGGIGSGMLPPNIRDLLAPYRNLVVV